MKKKAKAKIKEIILSVLFTIFLAFFPFLLLTIRAYAADSTNEYEEIFRTATAEDFEALEQVIWCESECAGCDFQVNVATAETVLNRVLSDEFPNTIYKVCHQKNQFVCKPIPDSADEYARENIADAICEVVNGGRFILPSTDYVYFATFKQKYASDHVWVGKSYKDKPIKGTGHWYGKLKKKGE